MAIELRHRLIGADEREDLDAYRRLVRAGSPLEGEALLDAVDRSGLRGRGGAAFPTGRKLRALREHSGPRFVIANGEEGEPASCKDRWLLRTRPHLVLDGALVAARAVEAERLAVYLSDRLAAASVAAALAEIGTTDIEVEVELVEPGYVAGEETSAVRAIGGGPAKPLAKPPRPFESGVMGWPTLVSNVETLAHVAWIAHHGPDAFRDLGSAGSPGTALLTVSGAVARPGLYEVPLGLSLDETVAITAGPGGDCRGYLMGGFFGGILAPERGSVALDYDALRALDSGLGCGAIVVLGEDDCPVHAAADVLGYFARENAKQCGACINGTTAMADTVRSITEAGNRPAADDALDRLRRWSVSLRGRGACATLDGAAVMTASLLREFAGPVADHVARGCPVCENRPIDPLTAGQRFVVPIQGEDM